MVQPLDGVTAIHNAFRADMAAIDAAAQAAARDAGPGPDPARVAFHNEMLMWHARGEEIAIFPALETVAPDTARPYEMDHRGLDAAAAWLDAAMADGEALETARAAAALRFHHDLHLDKEDDHLYRLLRERLTVPEQGKAAGIMAAQVPQERFPELVAWLFPLIGEEDRANMTRIWQLVMPEPAFARVKALIRSAVGDGWGDLTGRVSGLE
jgi:hypothetical protein